MVGAIGAIVTFKCRQFDREGTEQDIESDDAIYAPDLYVAKFVQMGWIGAITFIEVLVDGQWVCWAVECLSVRPLMLATAQITADKARAEIKAVQS